MQYFLWVERQLWSKEGKKDYIHPALRADEKTMLSKPQKCHINNQTETGGESTTAVSR
jgi:hypothetical protein